MLANDLACLSRH